VVGSGVAYKRRSTSYEMIDFERSLIKHVTLRLFENFHTVLQRTFSCFSKDRHPIV